MALITEGRYRRFEHNVIQSLETIKTKLQDTAANLDEITEAIEHAETSATAAETSAGAAAESAAASATAAGLSQDAAETAQSAAEAAAETAAADATTEAIATIEARAAEIEADWPEDYSDLTDDVSDLKSAISTLQYTLDNIAPFDIDKQTVQYATKETSELSHDYEATATGYGSATPRIVYTLADYPNIEVGDIIFVSALLYATAGSASDWESLYRPNIFGQSMADQNIDYNTWVPYAKRYTQSSNVGKSVTFAYSYKSTSAANGKSVHLRNLVVVNLTKTYGAGKEPTIEEMSALVEENGGYFESVNLFDTKQVANDVDSLKTSVSAMETNVFIDFENGYKYSNPSLSNDGSGYALNTNGTSVSITSSSRGVDGDIIYTWGEFKVKSTASCSRMYVTRGGNESTAIEEPDDDTWYPMSARYNRKSTVTAVQFTGEWASNARITIYYKHLVSINLTQVFGQYNEPSRDLLDKYFYAVSQANAMDFEAINAKMLNLGDSTRKLSYPSGSYVYLDEEHNVKMGSVPDPYWPGWQEIGTYGQFNVANIPVYNKVHGTLETDGMISVLPIWGCWSEAASSGNTHHGGHVFHGWTTDRMHRLTMVQNIYSDDEAAVFNYIPGDKSDTSEGVFLPLRLGADNVYKGMLIEPIYNPENLASYRMSRVTVYGRLNISKPQNYNSIPSSASADGVKGDICADENYIYVCTGTNTWKRVPLQTWS